MWSTEEGRNGIKIPACQLGACAGKTQTVTAMNPTSLHFMVKQTAYTSKRQVKNERLSVWFSTGGGHCLYNDLL